MATAPATPCKIALHDMTVRAPALARLNGDAKGSRNQISQYFGENAFGARQMRDKLPKKVFQKLQATIRLGKKLDGEIAAPVAEAIKEWAVSKGVTHYTHWFQPQTGLT